MGQMVALLVAGGASYVWLQKRPETPLGGAGGAIFPVLVVITLLYFAAAWLGPILDENIFNKANARKLRAQRFGGPFLRDVVRARDKAGPRLGREALGRLDAAIDALEQALDGNDADTMERALHDLETVYGELLHRKRKGLFRDFTESIGGALLIALLLRLFVLEAFKIPSGSMIPTLAIGDHIFVNKFAYGLTIPFASPPKKLFMLRDPQPGDVVVFIAPEPADNAGEDFIKRVVAKAGQKIKLRDGVLLVDGKEYARSPGAPLEYQDSMESGRNCLRRTATEHTENTNGVSHSVLYDGFGVHDFPNGYPPVLNGMKCTDEECEVLPGYVFCMGDNRDNSADSRRWGAVPLQNVKGKAMFIWMSMDNCPKPGFLSSIRWERLGKGIQ
jgi:signal peptidase I